MSLTEGRPYAIISSFQTCYGRCISHSTDQLVFHDSRPKLLNLIATAPRWWLMNMIGWVRSTRKSTKRRRCIRLWIDVRNLIDNLLVNRNTLGNNTRTKEKISISKMNVWYPCQKTLLCITECLSNVLNGMMEGVCSTTAV